MGNSCQLRPLSAAPTVNFCFPLPFFLMLQIFTWHAVCVCCACVRENFPRFLLDGVNQNGKVEGKRQGQGAGTACCICFEGKLSKAFQLCSGFCGPPLLFTHLPCSSFPPLLSFSSPSARATCHIPCYLRIWLRFITMSKLHFENLLKEREKSHSHTLSIASAPLFLSLSSPPLFPPPSVTHM